MTLRDMVGAVKECASRLLIHWGGAVTFQDSPINIVEMDAYGNTTCSTVLTVLTPVRLHIHIQEPYSEKLPNSYPKHHTGRIEIKEQGKEYTAETEQGIKTFLDWCWNPEGSILEDLAAVKISSRLANLNLDPSLQQLIDWIVADLGAQVIVCGDRRYEVRQVFQTGDIKRHMVATLMNAVRDRCLT